MGELSFFPRPHDGPVLVVPPAPQWLRAARLAGWRVQCGPLAPVPFDQAGALVVATETWTAGQVVLALSRGAGVVLDPADPTRLSSVMADVRRLGAVVWPEPQLERHSAWELDADIASLLDALARGRPVAGAARQAHMSLRTAHRRLRQAREVLGASTTAEAVGRWAQRSEQLTVGSW